MATPTADGGVTLDPGERKLAREACDAWLAQIASTLQKRGISYSGIARQDMAETADRLRALRFDLSDDDE